MKTICRLFALLCALSLGLGCREKGEYLTVSGYAQGGVYAVKVGLDGVKETPDRIREAIDSILTAIDTTLSGYNKASQLSRLGRGEAIQAAPMLRDIYARSYRIWEESDGALDVAAGPLFDAWGFGFTHDSLPSDEKVQQILASCGMKRLRAEMGPDGSVSDGGPAPRLNFNAIAQGYSCDLVAAYLYRIGARNMLVNIGEIYLDGVNPDGKPWRIGVDRPEDGNQTPGAKLEAVWASGGGPCGVVTSGNYRKFYEKDGRKYAHTIDPRSGYPVSHNLLSATIVAPDATTADAYATICMVIGLEASKALLQRRDDLEGYLVYDDRGQMKTWNSEGFQVIAAPQD